VFFLTPKLKYGVGYEVVWTEHPNNSGSENDKRCWTRNAYTWYVSSGNKDTAQVFATDYFDSQRTMKQEFFSGCNAIYFVGGAIVIVYLFFTVRIETQSCADDFWRVDFLPYQQRSHRILILYRMYRCLLWVMLISAYCRQEILKGKTNYPFENWLCFGTCEVVFANLECLSRSEWWTQSPK